MISHFAEFTRCFFSPDECVHKIHSKSTPEQVPKERLSLLIASCWDCFIMNTLNGARLHLCLTVILAAFIATSLFESLPLSSASTSTGTNKAPQRKGLFRRSRASTKERSAEGTSGDDGVDALKETKIKKKTSWQFFYQKKEDTTEETEDSQEGDVESKTDGDKEEEHRDEESEQEKKDSKDRDIERTEESGDQDDDTTHRDKSNDDSNEVDDSKKNKETENDDNEEDDKNQDPKRSEKSEETKAKSSQKQSQDPMQLYRNQLIQQQRFLSPGAIMYRSSPPMNGSAMQQQPGMPNQSTAMATTALINLVSLASRLFFLKWIIDKLAFESESKSPVQHFMWECLNDKFIKDDAIWNRVLNRVPHSMGVSQRKWGKTVKAMGPNSPKKKNSGRTPKKGRNKKIAVSKSRNVSIPANDDDENQQSSETKLKTSPVTSKTVVVMDFSTVNVANPDFLRFADVVTFLVSSNNPKKQMFGQKPEIILTLLSPGGEVTSFAFAAAQVARLRDAGWNVTVCVDRIAASGGYMIASQATQILASPFAMVGSVGVITEALNFYEILKKHGIQSLVLKAGDNKNPLTQFGQVTDKDIKTTQKDLDETHESFIALCRSRRPTLDPAVCNGRILSGDKALERGMIDRIITSDEYILEKISAGDLVMRLHLVSGNSQRNTILAALQILPHLKSRFKNFLFAGGDNSLVGKMNAVMDGNFATKAIQIMGLASMIRRAIMRHEKSSESF